MALVFDPSDECVCFKNEWPHYRLSYRLNWAEVGTWLDWIHSIHYENRCWSFASRKQLFRWHFSAHPSCSSPRAATSPHSIMKSTLTVLQTDQFSHERRCKPNILTYRIVNIIHIWNWRWKIPPVVNECVIQQHRAASTQTVVKAQCSTSYIMHRSSMINGTEISPQYDVPVKWKRGNEFGSSQTAELGYLRSRSSEL